MDLLQRFQEHWRQQFSQLAPAHGRLLLAVSGGVDSVVLVDLIHKSGIPFSIAHVNFQLRREESERDENFVRSLSEKYGCEVLVKRADTKHYAADQKISIQEAAREIRYTWFKEIIAGWQKDNPSNNSQPSSPNWILTAHHADDNIETLLMHFFRGTGIEGMTGIKPVQKEWRLLRTLLPFKKQELLQYATENGLSFVEDSSNASDKYTRNYFRNQLLPQIKEVFPAVEESLQNNIQRFAEAAVLYKHSVDSHLKGLVEQKGTEWHIPVLKWKKIMPLQTISWEIIRPYGFSAVQTDEIIKLLDAHNGSSIESSAYRIIKNRNWMIIAPLQTETANHIIIEKENSRIHFENGSIEITIADPTIKLNDSTLEAFIDMKDISFPLLMRKWKQGDYFYPLGMQKKKKLSRFFIDQKLSKTEKEKVWVLESNKKICWVIGLRIDNRFRINNNTQQVLHLTYLK